MVAKPISIKELVERLVAQGYRITETTVHFYLKKEGLLPEPKKIGQGREGVKLVFPDDEVAIRAIKEIFKWKGRGYKLSEIRGELLKRKALEKLERRGKFLKSFVKVGDDVLKRLDEKPGPDSTLYMAENLAELFKPSMRKDYDLVECGPFTEIKKDILAIEELGIIRPLHIFETTFVYDIKDIGLTRDWLLLRHEFGVELPTIKRIVERQSENLDRFFYVPDADGVRFSELSIEWEKRENLNMFGFTFMDVINNVTSGCPAFKIAHGWIQDMNWDSHYATVNEFIDDFLNGACAFVSCYAYEPRIILKKFE